MLKFAYTWGGHSGCSVDVLLTGVSRSAALKTPFWDLWQLANGSQVRRTHTFCGTFCVSHDVALCVSFNQPIFVF